MAKKSSRFIGQSTEANLLWEISQKLDRLTQVTSKTISTAPYLVYTALLSQTGTDAPVATVFQNTIGSIVWSRNSDGIYQALLSSAFTINKTFLHCELNYNTCSANFANCTTVDADKCYFYTYSDATSNLPLVYTDLLGDGLFVEIRVYP